MFEIRSIRLQGVKSQRMNGFVSAGLGGFDNRLTEHQAANEHRREDSGGIGDQTGRHGMPGFFDADRAEIDRQHVKCGFGAAVNRQRQPAEPDEAYCLPDQYRQRSAHR